MASTALVVEFGPDGRCIVSIRGASPQASDGGARLQAADPAGGAFRCPLPYRALGTAPVDLRVVLASGVERPADSFPRLGWHREGQTWVGTAALPATPSFVSLGRRSPAPPGGVAFGWNFYGFFVFAAAFIAVYLASVRSTRRRAPAAAR